MANLIESIKQAAVEAVAAEKPVMVRCGTVTNCNPFCVRLDSKILLNKDFLLISELYYTRAKMGDQVLLLSCQGGQKFAVLDRVVNI